MAVLSLRLVLLAAGCGFIAGPAAAIAPSEAARSPLERAAFVAVPAIYEVQVTIRVDSAIVAGMTRSLGKELTFRGTGFGVGQDRVATARHLLAPPPERIRDELTASGVDTARGLADARFVSRRTKVILTRAHRQSSPAGSAESDIVVTRVELGDVAGDVALIAIDDPAAPTLQMVDSQTTGTPVAIVGFGGTAPGAVPDVRFGSLSRLAEREGTGDDRFATVEADVARGDSGAPAITSEGDVVGMVIRDESRGALPVLARVTTIRSLLDKDGVLPVVADTTDTFRAGMAAFWRRDYDSAARLLAKLDGAYSDPALARLQASRARALLDSEYDVSGPPRRRSALLAFGAMAALAAAAFGIVRARLTES